MPSIQNGVKLGGSLLLAAILSIGGIHSVLAAAPQVAGTVVVAELPQDCSPESLAGVKARADKGDVHAQHLIGMQYYLGACGDPDRAAAIRALSKSAARMYPPSMYHLATNLQSTRGANDKKLLSLYLGAAERGFRKAELDVVELYSRKKSPVYNRAEAYAWIHYCAQHDSFCSDDDMMTKVMTGLSARDKARGEELKAKLVE